MGSSYTGSEGVELVFTRSLKDQMETSFELFCAEWLVYATFVVGMLHAYKNGGEHMLFIMLSLAAASFVDPFCLISEQIRNYFHSHASILLWDRHVAPWQFPLFACISYVPGAVVWMLNLHVVAEALLVVFVSSWSFYCFDLFACRWLLYQWHVTDPLYTARTECVPLASSMWVCAYAGTASLLARLAYKYLKTKGLKNIKMFDMNWWAMFFVSVLIFLPLHIAPISLFYFPAFFFQTDLEYYCVWAFTVGCLIIGVASINFLPKLERPNHVDKYKYLVFLQSAIWLGSLLYVLVTIDPKDVVSTSVHQPYGGAGVATSSLCTERETYLFGMSDRQRYVCDEDLAHWKIDIDPTTKQMPKIGDEWYTIRGLPMDADFMRHYLGSWVFTVVIHVIIFAISFMQKRSTEDIAKKTN